MIQVAEVEFEAVAGAAVDAAERGDMDTAHILDKLARKINADLSARATRRLLPGVAFVSTRRKMSWRDVPSVLDK